MKSRSVCLSVLGSRYRAPPRALMMLPASSAFKKKKKKKRHCIFLSFLNKVQFCGFQKFEVKLESVDSCEAGIQETKSVNVKKQKQN